MNHAGTPDPARRALHPEDNRGGEQALILAVRAGDMDAVGVLYEKCRSNTLAFARSLVWETHDAEDVFHDAFTKSIKAITNGVGPSENFLAYLYTAVRATAAGRWRRNTRELPDESIDRYHGAPPLGPTDVGADHAAYEHVLTALRSLPIRWQRVLWYADVLQEKPRHIAPLMGITPNAVSALILRARRGLRAAYALQSQTNTNPAGCSPDNAPDNPCTPSPSAVSCANSASHLKSDEPRQSDTLCSKPLRP